MKIFVLILFLCLCVDVTFAKKEKPSAKPRVFVDVVYKIKEEGEKSSVIFRRAAAVYEVKDKKILSQLQESQKRQKSVQVSADVNDNLIQEVKGP